ncbi:N-terminal amidase [Colletotrichum scovillei]|uniref:N-terminal amidase n=1 Tax=Colletotrichum scovillei TaxID=1209932 RepID=UPI0015C3445D|nr:N-terminal amidase [Colletotrichum scovillei]KAF4780479.1 N-terminal amidase [Colletotrichum scovillei]
MRIGCLQFAPQVGDVDNNLNRADSVLNKANPDDLDLLVLPELAFSGYNFKSLQQISPFLEHSGSGITSLWARTTALKYNCTVLAGYPEKVDVSQNWPTSPEYYNAAIVVNEEGETIANYRKSFLYYTDETWALEGDGFFDGYLPGLGNTSIGICMDLNPYRFESPWHEFEFAFHVAECESNLVIVSMAWMTREDGRMFSRMPNEPDMDTLTYWVTRLEPLIRTESHEEIIVVFCNRTGIEDEVVYAGTSAVIGIQDGEKELLVVDTNNPPYAKLVYRPEVDKPSVLHGELQMNGDSGGDSGTPFGSLSPTSPQQPPSNGDQDTSSQSSGERRRSKHQDSVAKHVALPSKRTKPPQIQIPGSAGPYGLPSKSPGADAFLLLTPTAPSPTPLSVRPKLTIPSFSADDNSRSPVPDSSRSAYSVHSVLSERSVVSNGRPPAESTPYPDSAHPLSEYLGGYGEKRIYGGHVSVAEAAFSQYSPNSARSPVSPQYFWRPPEMLSKSVNETRGRMITPDSPQEIQRDFHSLPWNDPYRRSHTSHTVRTAVTSVTVKQEHFSSTKAQETGSQQETRSRKLKSPPPETPEAPKSGRQVLSVTSSHEASIPDRPSSPKSRHASRSRVRDRSDSALAHRDQAAAIANHLEAISRRSESANRSRSRPPNNEPVQADRRSPSKPRGESRNRSAKEFSSIMIVASPSILDSEATRPQSASVTSSQKPSTPQPLSSTGRRARSGSANVSSRETPPVGRHRSRTPIASQQYKPGPSSRTVSRGRQPSSKYTTSKPATSISTPQPESKTSDVIRRESRRWESAAPKPSNVSRETPQPSFERIDSFRSPSCPVHGLHDASDSNRIGDIIVPRRIVAPDLGSPSSVSFLPPRTPGANKFDFLNEYIRQNTEKSVSDETTSGDANSLAETVETVSTTSRSPSTPFFEPKTPTAMIFVRPVDDVQYGHSVSPGFSPGLADLRCIDRNLMKTADIAKVAA